MIGRKLRSSCPLGGSIAVASGVPSISRSVRNSGISRWMCAFRPISCSKDTFEIGRKLCAALSCSLRKYFSTAWRIVSDSATASASLSIRNHVLPPDASQTYLMLPPTGLSGTDRHREGGDAMSGARRLRSPEQVNSFLVVIGYARTERRDSRQINEK